MTDDDYAIELPSGTALLHGRYVVDYRIGAGSVAAVYRAKTRDGRFVALKILHDESMQKAHLVERLRNEMLIGNALRGVPNVIPPTDHGELPELDDRVFVAFEYVRAHTIHRHLMEGPFSPLRACRIARTLAQTLAQLHDKGVIHRDVTAYNVLLDDTEQLYLIDFGFAHSDGSAEHLPATDGLTEAHHRPGTPEYMSPEQALGYPPSPSFDLYALASLLWTMVVGHHPYLGHPSEEIFRRKCDPSFPVPDVFSVFSRVDGAVADLIDRGLHRDPSSRPATARAYVEELDRVIARLERADTADPGDDVPRASLSGKTQRRRTAPAGAFEGGSRPGKDWKVRVVLGLAMVGGAGWLVAERFAEGRGAGVGRPNDLHAPAVGASSVSGRDGAPPVPPTRSAAAEREAVDASSASERTAADAKHEAVDASGPLRLPADTKTTAETQPVAARFTGEPPHRAAEASPTEKAAGSVVTPQPPRREHKHVQSGSHDEDAAACPAQEAAILEAEKHKDWKLVLQKTAQPSKCWSDTSRILRRIRAFQALGRFADCIAEGERSPSPEAQFEVALCRRSHRQN